MFTEDKVDARVLNFNLYVLVWRVRQTSEITL